MKVTDHQYTERMSKGEGSVFSTMLEFYPDDAAMWAGPFNEKYAFLSIDDCRVTWSLDTLAELRAGEEKELAKRKREAANHGCKRERKRLARYEFHWHLVQPSVERPIRVYICGNDDSSYSAFFPTLEEAREHVDLLIACQPLTREDIIHTYKFTN
jgi:hypothetical protein